MGRCFVWANLSLGCPYIFCDWLPWIDESHCANTWTRPVAVRQRSLLWAAGAVCFFGPDCCTEPVGYFTGITGVGITLAIRSVLWYNKANFNSYAPRGEHTFYQYQLRIM